ncbi:MAG: RNA polymerase sigma factor, partial [Gemmatimonadales bacterium]
HGAAQEMEPSASVSSERVEHAMMELNAAHREAFVLKYVEDMSYEEMAEVTGAGVSALKMRVSRARGFLRAALSEVLDA